MHKDLQSYTDIQISTYIYTEVDKDKYECTVLLKDIKICTELHRGAWVHVQ